MVRAYQIEMCKLIVKLYYLGSSNPKATNIRLCIKNISSPCCSACSETTVSCAHHRVTLLIYFWGVRGACMPDRNVQTDRKSVGFWLKQS